MSDKHLDVFVSLQELYDGVKKTVEYERFVICSQCDDEKTDDHHHRHVSSKYVKKIACVECLGHGVLRNAERMVLCSECTGCGEVIDNLSNKLNESKLSTIICPSCNSTKMLKVKETIVVDVVRGTYPGDTFTFYKRANQHPKIITKDLIVHIRVRPHPFFGTIDHSPDLVLLVDKKQKNNYTNSTSSTSLDPDSISSVSNASNTTSASNTITDLDGRPLNFNSFDSINNNSSSTNSSIGNSCNLLGLGLYKKDGMGRGKLVSLH